MAEERPERDDLYEGCGRIGQIRSIFFAEFHPITGPMIRVQAPESRELITKEVFDAFSVFEIPKAELDRTPLTVNALGYKICGYPIILKDEKYKRNEFMFNVAFVCHPWSRTVQYEPAVKKLAHFLVDLELEIEFLSDEKYSTQLQRLLEKVYSDLNERKECSAVIFGYSLHLKVIAVQNDPEMVNDWDVPVLQIKWDESQENAIKKEDWDLTTQQILPHVNGINFIGKIAALARVDSSLVRAAIQNLLYHRVVKLNCIFMYSNVYCLTPSVKLLREDEDLREKFMNYIKRDENFDNRIVTFRDVYRMICEFDNHTSVVDICHQFRPRENMNICEFRFVTFLMLHGIIRRVHKYPVYVSESNSGCLANGNIGGVEGAAAEYYHFFTGQKHFDEICCKTGLSARSLEEIIDNDPNVYVLRK